MSSSMDSYVRFIAHPVITSLIFMASIAFLAFSTIGISRFEVNLSTKKMFAEDSPLRIPNETERKIVHGFYFTTGYHGKRLRILTDQKNDVTDYTPYGARSRQELATQEHFFNAQGLGHPFGMFVLLRPLRADDNFLRPPMLAEASLIAYFLFACSAPILIEQVGRRVLLIVTNRKIVQRGRSNTRIRSICWHFTFAVILTAGLADAASTMSPDVIEKELQRAANDVSFAFQSKILYVAVLMTGLAIFVWMLLISVEVIRVRRQMNKDLAKIEKLLLRKTRLVDMGADPGIIIDVDDQNVRYALNRVG